MSKKKNAAQKFSVAAAFSDFVEKEFGFSVSDNDKEASTSTSDKSIKENSEAATAASNPENAETGGEVSGNGTTEEPKTLTKKKTATKSLDKRQKLLEKRGELYKKLRKLEMREISFSETDKEYNRQEALAIVEEEKIRKCLVEVEKALARKNAFEVEPDADVLSSLKGEGALRVFITQTGNELLNQHLTEQLRAKGMEKRSVRDGLMFSMAELDAIFSSVRQEEIKRNGKSKIPDSVSNREKYQKFRSEVTAIIFNSIREARKHLSLLCLDDYIPEADLDSYNPDGLALPSASDGTEVQSDVPIALPKSINEIHMELNDLFACGEQADAAEDGESSEDLDNEEDNENDEEEEGYDDDGEEYEDDEDIGDEEVVEDEEIDVENGLDANVVENIEDNVNVDVEEMQNEEKETIPVEKEAIPDDTVQLEEMIVDVEAIEVPHNGEQVILKENGPNESVKAREEQMVESKGRDRILLGGGESAANDERVVDEEAIDEEMIVEEQIEETAGASNISVVDAASVVAAADEAGRRSVEDDRDMQVLLMQSRPMRTTQEPSSSSDNSAINTTALANIALNDPIIINEVDKAHDAYGNSNVNKIDSYPRNRHLPSSSVQVTSRRDASDRAESEDVMQETADDDEVQIIGNGAARENGSSSSIIIDYEGPAYEEPEELVNNEKNDYVQQWLDNLEPIVTIDLLDSDDEEEKNAGKQKQEGSKKNGKRPAPEKDADAPSCSKDVSIPSKKFKQGNLSTQATSSAVDATVSTTSPDLFHNSFDNAPTRPITPMSPPSLEGVKDGQSNQQLPQMNIEEDEVIILD